jgi:hypothetical protein
MFQTFYESSLQHPWLLLVAPLVFLPTIVTQSGPFYRALLIFCLLTILDPLMAGPLADLFGLSPSLAKSVEVFFVILGDFRWFFFFELFPQPPLNRKPMLTKRLWVVLLLSLLVPLVQAGLLSVFPAAFADSRRVFLAYELLFFCLALVLLLFRTPHLDLRIRRFKRELCWYGLLYYGLWALSDLVILSGFDAGYLLRVVPNQLYYSFFLPFVWWRARSSLGALS